MHRNWKHLQVRPETHARIQALQQRRQRSYERGLIKSARNCESFSQEDIVRWLLDLHDKADTRRRRSKARQRIKDQTETMSESYEGSVDNR